jgi:hypothetical protein
MLTDAKTLNDRPCCLIKGSVRIPTMFEVQRILPTLLIDYVKSSLALHASRSVDSIAPLWQALSVPISLVTLEPIDPPYLQGQPADRGGGGGVVDPDHRLAPIWFPFGLSVGKRGHGESQVKATICLKENALVESLSPLPFFLPLPQQARFSLLLMFISKSPLIPTLALSHLWLARRWR